MEESFSKSIVTKIGIAILTISLVDLFYLNYWVLKSQKLKVESGKFAQENRQVEPEPSPSPEASASFVDYASPSPTSVPAFKESTVKTVTTIQTAQKEIFIPIGSGSTKSGTFADLSGVEVTIDPSKYSQIDSMVFEATVWVEGGNGRAWGQLYVVDDKNPLIESQISNALATGNLKTSGKIPIPPHTKTYRVQAKSELTNFAAHVENARIKITLK